LKFNDEHVPDSPFKVYISPAVGDAHLLEVIQFPEGYIQADKPSQFIVRRNGAKGNLDAKVIIIHPNKRNNNKTHFTRYFSLRTAGCALCQLDKCDCFTQKHKQKPKTNNPSERISTIAPLTTGGS
jgi:hypothetical protein